MPVFFGLLKLAGEQNINYNNAGGSVQPHLRVLRAVGFCRLARNGVPGIPTPLRHRLHGAYHVFAQCVTVTFVLQQLVYAYQEMDDMDKLSNVLFVLLCHTTCIAKQLVFHLDAARLDELIASLDEPLFNPQDEASSAALRVSSQRAARLLRGFLGCSVSTCVLWSFLGAGSRLRGLPVELPFWTGFHYDHPLTFMVVLLYSFYTTNLVAIGQTTMDVFIVTILYQCKTQLTIVRNNFESLPERARSSSERSGLNFDAVLHESFVDCLVHYKKITECCSLLETIFGSALLVQFGLGSWTLCMATYKIVSLNLLSIEFTSTMLFIICIGLELLLYCHFGNEVSVESDRVAEALYCMEWTSLSPRFRRSMLVVMTRAQRPLRPAAGAVIPLTLQTYVTIIKSSYSFYAMLRQTK